MQSKALSTHQASASLGKNANAPRASVDKCQVDKLNQFYIGRTIPMQRTGVTVGVQALPIQQRQKYRVDITGLSEVRALDSDHLVITAIASNFTTG